MSSSICSPCGQRERDAREEAEVADFFAYQNSPFGQFMSMSEDDRWRMIFDRLEAMEAR